MRKITFIVTCLYLCIGAFNSVIAGTKKQKTFGMIKPSGIARTNEIKNIITSYKLKLLSSKRITLTEKQFADLYVMHKGKPFYKELHDAMVGKEVEVMIIYGDDAVSKYRDAVVDIRSKYALNKTENAVHGSDSEKRAKKEICIFFNCNRKKAKSK